MKETIFRRRSVRSYQDKAVDQDLMDGIIAFIGGVKRLYPEIRVQARVLEPSRITMTQPWRAPHCLAIYSEQQPGWLENAGFMFQQVDLYLQSIGLGSCWVGLGKPDSALTPDGMEPVILMPFGYPKNSLYRNERSQFRRKSMEEIADYPDERLEAVRVAPSATNSQPWYFVHEGEHTLHVYRRNQGRLLRHALNKMNQIDIGIALAHLYVAHGEGFAFRRLESPPEKEGLIYMGTVVLP